MYKHGRGDSSRTRRRGNARRKQYVGVVAAVLVIYLVYRSFMPDSDDTKFEALRASKLSQKMLVQGELRNQAPKSETPVNSRPDLSRSEAVGNIIIEDGESESNETKNDSDKDPGEGDVIQSLTDRYNQAKGILKEVNQNVITQDNTISSKLNMTFPSESAQRMNPFLSHNLTKVTTNLTESNLTFTNESTERIDLFLFHNNGNITSKTIAMNTSEIQGAKPGIVLSNDTVNDIVEESKVKIEEDFAAQTKQLVSFMKETFSKNGTRFSDLNSQNKTNLDRNTTDLVESFSAKAQEVLSLAKDLLTDRNTSILSENQDIMRLNDTQLEKIFSAESQYIVKIANEVFLKTNATGLKEKDVEKTKLLDKYSFYAQRLRKFASRLLPNRTEKVVKTQQKLFNIELTKDNKLPIEFKQFGREN